MIAALGPELPLWDAVLRVLVAVVLTAAIGLERELRDQEAGLRTHMLVGLGSALFVIVGNFGWEGLTFGDSSGIMLDPSRVVAYVVTGIGFLGAGTIIKHGLSVRGLTTAASLWVAAAIGVTIGAGEWALGLVAAAAVILSLWPVKEIGRLVEARAVATHRLEVQLDPGAPVGPVVEAVEARGDRVVSARVVDEPDIRRLELVVVEREARLASLADTAADVPGARSATVAR